MKNKPRQLNSITHVTRHYGFNGFFKAEVTVKNDFTPIIGEIIEFENQLFVTSLIERNYTRLFYDESKNATNSKYQDVITLINIEP